MAFDLTASIKETARKNRPNGKGKHTVLRDSGVTLNYYTLPYTGKRSINKGRLELWPDIHLEDYTFSAVVDWVRISFDTTGFHQAVNIKRWASTIVDRGQTLYVYGPNGERGFKGHEFTLTLQDPTPDSLDRLCRAIEGKYEIDTAERQAIRIDGIEVSLDIYPNNETDEDRRKMTEALRRHVVVPEMFWEDRLAHPRSTYGIGFERNRRNPTVEDPKLQHKVLSRAATHPAQTPAHFRDLDPDAYRQAPVDGTFYFGKRKGVAMVRIQDKVTNQRTGTWARKLKQHEKRSRIEVTLDRFALRGLKVEFEADIRDLGFDHLVAGVFATSMLTLAPDGEGADSDELRVFEKAGVLGLDRYQRAKRIQRKIEARAGSRSEKPSPLHITGHRISWAAFRRRSRKALKRLEKQWGG
ncbi:hypothetical protein [Tropicimonas sediminicola]|nr:hypothetical protein [Tropicimonas sediminicola]